MMGHEHPQIVQASETGADPGTGGAALKAGEAVFRKGGGKGYVSVAAGGALNDIRPRRRDANLHRAPPGAGSRRVNSA